MSGVHARLSASSAHRWLACPPSARYKDDKGSVFAATGTYAHDIAAKCLDDNSLQPMMFLGKKAKVDGFDVECDLVRVDAINLYLDQIAADLKPGDQCWTEMPLLQALSRIDPDMGGTADYVRYRSATQHLLVMDFKYGSGVYVEADDNDQLKVYALGAMLECGKAVKEVTVRIVQPRFEGAAPVRSWSFKASDILEFVADVQEAAERSRAEDTPFKAGDHCKFCAHARDCKELERHQHSITLMEFGTVDVQVPDGKKTKLALAPKPGAIVDHAKLAEALKSIPLVKERIKALEEFAYAEATAGREIPGYKLVDKVAHRKWRDESAVVLWAEAKALDPYAPREVISPAQMERLIAPTMPKGQKTKGPALMLEPLVERVSSGTALVPVTDARAPAKLITANDFEVVS